MFVVPFLIPFTTPVDETDATELSSVTKDVLIQLIFEGLYFDESENDSPTPILILLSMLNRLGASTTVTLQDAVYPDINLPYTVAVPGAIAVIFEPLILTIFLSETLKTLPYQ